MNENGLSIFEIVITLAIVSVVGILLVSVLISSTNVFQSQSAVITQGMNLNDVLSKIKANIKVSQYVSTGYPEDSPNYTSSSNQLVLKLPSIDNNSNIINNTFDYYIYHVIQTKLEEKVFPNAQSVRRASDRTIVTNVESILFEYFDELSETSPPANAKKVRVTLTVKQKIGIGDKISVATSEALLKNN